MTHHKHLASPLRTRVERGPGAGRTMVEVCPCGAERRTVRCEGKVARGAWEMVSPADRERGRAELARLMAEMGLDPPPPG